MTVLARTMTVCTPPLRRLRELLVAAWGLPMPMRDTALLAVVTFVLLVDSYHDLFPGTDWISGQSLDRGFLNLVVPLAALLLLGERPADYGLRLGNWRLGLLLLGLGMAATTPLMFWFGSLPDAQAYYGARAGSTPLYIVLSDLFDVGSAEFLFRGVLMGVLVRRCGPLGVAIATFPFVFTHLGKPELETLSCFFGGIGFGWLAFRTRSVLYGGLLHTYFLSLVYLLNA